MTDTMSDNSEYTKETKEKRKVTDDEGHDHEAEVKEKTEVKQKD